MKNGSRQDGMSRRGNAGFRILTLSALLIFGTAAAVQAQTEQPTHVSIISLIANPERYEGKVVQLQGFVTVEYELTAVWLDADRFKNSDVDNAISLRLFGDQGVGDLFEEAKQYDLKVVPIVGRFSTKGHGFLGLYPAEITVERIGRVTR